MPVGSVSLIAFGRDSAGATGFACRISKKIRRVSRGRAVLRGRGRRSSEGDDHDRRTPARRGGAGAGASAAAGDYDSEAYRSTDNTGGTIMGADPATSVVNKWLQMWDEAAPHAGAVPHHQRRFLRGFLGKSQDGLSRDW
jgi:hypothetical protein